MGSNNVHVITIKRGCPKGQAVVKESDRDQCLVEEKPPGGMVVVKTDNQYADAPDQLPSV